MPVTQLHPPNFFGIPAEPMTRATYGTTTMSSASTFKKKKMTRKASALSTTAIATASFLSIFMLLIFLSPKIRNENLNTREIVHLQMEELAITAKELHNPSMHAMLNFTWLDGTPQQYAWINLYWVRKLHFGLLPVTTWLIIAPFQLSNAFRLKYPWLHRRLGYAFFFASSCVAIGLLILISTGRVLGYPHWLAMAMNICKATYFLVSMYRAYIAAAVHHNYTVHQKWICRHLTMGYTVSFQRILLIIIGPMLHAQGSLPIEIENQDRLTSKELQIWYNLTTLLGLLIPLVIVETRLWSSSSSQSSVGSKGKED